MLSGMVAPALGLLLLEPLLMLLDWHDTNKHLTVPSSEPVMTAHCCPGPAAPVAPTPTAAAASAGGLASTTTALTSLA
jgi:hypothetical protein